MYPWTRTNLLHFESHPPPDPDFLEEFLTTLQDKHFPQFISHSHLSNNWSDLYENFMTDVSLVGEVPIKLWKSSHSSGSRVDSGSTPDSPWRRSAFSECSRLNFYLGLQGLRPISVVSLSDIYDRSCTAFNRVIITCVYASLNCWGISK